MAKTNPDSILERLAGVQAAARNSSSETKGTGRRSPLPGGSLATRRAKGDVDSKAGQEDSPDEVRISGASDETDWEAAMHGVARQLLDHALGAGGMASAGALQSILSWADKELEQNGQLTAEMAAIVRETLERAVEYGLMDEEEAADLSGRYFPPDS